MAKIPDKQGIWKIHPDGSGAAQLVSGGGYPEVSPDGQYAAYGAADRHRFVRIVDGATVPFEIRDDVRMRWMPDGRAVAFVGKDEKGLGGVFVQDFIPGQDTTRTRRKLAGFDPEMTAEADARHGEEAVEHRGLTIGLNEEEAATRRPG